MSNSKNGGNSSNNKKSPKPTPKPVNPPHLPTKDVRDDGSKVRKQK